MKNLYLFLFLGLLFFTSRAQSKFSSEDWQVDLDFLQNTILQEYKFLFKKTTVAEFNSEVDKLKKSIPHLEEHEIIVGFAKIISLFKYGHTSLGLSGWRNREQFNFHQMPYNLYAFNDGIFIQGTQEAYEKSLGAKVLKVEGIDIKEATEAVKPVFPTENEQFFKAYGLNYLGNAEILHAQRVTSTLKNGITLTLEKNGTIFTQKFHPITKKEFPGKYTLITEGEGWLDARNNSMDPLYLKHLDRIYYFEYLPEYKAVYIRHSQIQDDPHEDIPSFYSRVFEFVEKNDVDKFILDVRLNGGGNNYKNKPIVTGLIKSKINQPGKLFVIIGRHTFSACQNLVNELDNYTESIFVGEPTGENINFYGDNQLVTLPNSQIPIRLSFAWWQDKPQWENGPWLAPHLAVDMSFEEYAKNQDPVLQAALEFSAENFILDPMAYLTDLYLSGQVDKLQSEAFRMVHDPSYQFFDFEGEFNNLGYNLLERGQKETALSVFQLIVGLFPQSANAYDSLAEGYWRNGNLDKAIENYKKAISLDPEGKLGENSRKMLKKILDQKE